MQHNHVNFEFLSEFIQTPSNRKTIIMNYWLSLEWELGMTNTIEKRNDRQLDNY